MELQLIDRVMTGNTSVVVEKRPVDHHEIVNVMELARFVRATAGPGSARLQNVHRLLCDDDRLYHVARQDVLAMIDVTDEHRRRLRS